MKVIEYGSKVPIRSYRDLDLWKLSITLAVAATKASHMLPREELYALGDQIRRAAHSIAANVAEGHGRGTSREFRRYLLIANGSRVELETHLTIAVALQYIDEGTGEELNRLSNRIGQMITALRKALAR